MSYARFALTCVLMCAATARADDRDDAIFGSEPTPSADAPAPVARPTTALVDKIAETLSLGGRVELSSAVTKYEDGDAGSANFSRALLGELYFDARPNPEFRSLLRLRVSDGTQSATPGTTLQTDEAWVRFVQNRAVFYTVGKQHLKWGSGKFWNPTDFLAGESRDPFASFDRRLGTYLLKVHVPQEKQGFNYYALLNMNDAARVNQLSGALRGEFALFGQTETALTAAFFSAGSVKLGADFSAALGPIDAYVESAFLHKERRRFYSGRFDPTAGDMPTTVDRSDEWLRQTTAGASYTWKYADDDNISFGAEYFDNGLGYSDLTLELYALLSNDAQPLYIGRKYAGGYVRLAKPGSWNDTTFMLTGLSNLSDRSTTARLTTSWELATATRLEWYLSRCFGEIGEFCLALPKQYQALADAPSLPGDLPVGFQERLRGLPRSKVEVASGLGLTVEF